MYDSVIERVISFIEERKISENELSKKIGVPQKTVNNYLSKKRKMSIEFLQSFSSTFGLTIDWLINGEINKETSNKEVGISNREYFDQMNKLTTQISNLVEQNSKLSETIISQQRIIESLQNEKKESCCPRGRSCRLCRCKRVRCGIEEFIIPKY